MLAAQARKIARLERQLADATKGKMPDLEDLDPGEIRSSAMVRSQDGNPAVQIKWFLSMAQIEPEGARHLAFSLLRMADIAEAESSIYKFATEKIGLGRNEAGGLVYQFREFQESRRTNAEPWDLNWSVQKGGDDGKI